LLDYSSSSLIGFKGVISLTYFGFLRYFFTALTAALTSSNSSSSEDSCSSSEDSSVSGTSWVASGFRAQRF
jgi:hypothetical protein